MTEEDQINEAVKLICRNSSLHPLVSTACSRLGISQKDLLSKNLRDFLLVSGSKETAEADLRYYEDSRKAKLNLIGKFLLDRGLVDVKKRLKKSSSKPASKPMPSPEAKFEILKKNLLKKIKVAKNLKSLKIEEEKKRKNFEEKLLAKSCRSESKNSTEQKAKFARHDLRIKELLDRKYRDIEERETRAISSMSTKRENLKIHSVSFSANRKIQQNDLDLDIGQKLEEFDKKMSRSTERAKKALWVKTNSSSALISNVQKVRAVKEDIDLKLKQKELEKISQISKRFLDSSKRREDRLGMEKLRISSSLNSQTNRQTAEKFNKELEEKQRKTEEKSRNKEKKAKILKESFDKGLQLSLAKSFQEKKKTHEVNLSRIQKQYEKIRSKMIEKVKESEARGRTEVSVSFIRSKLESKLISQIDI